MMSSHHVLSSPQIISPKKAGHIQVKKQQQQKTAYQLIFLFGFILPKVCLVKIWGALHNTIALGHYATLHRQSSMWRFVFMHQSFVSKAPTYGDSSGIAGLSISTASPLGVTIDAHFDYHDSITITETTIRIHYSLFPNKESLRILFLTICVCNCQLI